LPHLPPPPPRPVRAPRTPRQQTVPQCWHGSGANTVSAPLPAPAAPLPQAHLEHRGSKQCPYAAADGPSRVTQAPPQQRCDAEAATHTGRRSCTLHPGRGSIVNLVNTAAHNNSTAEGGCGSGLCVVLY
jgi:hypothetical protein